jgi:hypothetical protein
VELTEAGRALERQVHEAIAVVVEAWAELIGRDRLESLWESLQQITGEPVAPTDPAALRH